MDLPFVAVGLVNTGMAKLNDMLNCAGAFDDKNPVIWNYVLCRFPYGSGPHSRIHSAGIG
jgi:hypothetical protein